MTYTVPRQYNHISRYSIYRQILDDEQELYTETSNVTPIPETDKDFYHEILKEEENRLDIIANKYYGNPDFFWMIAIANNIIDPFIITPGEVIRIPNFNSLMQWKAPLCQRV